MNHLKLIALMVLLTGVALSHFGVIIPSDDMITQKDNRSLQLQIAFLHPMEMDYMSMEKPAAFFLYRNGKRTNLLSGIREEKVEGHTAWSYTYKIKRPGDHIFVVEPKPYWEPAEDCYIVHYTKVIVNSMGLEDGWDQEVGLKAEIIPLTRPYGLWAGNIFRGIVKFNGKPAPYAEIEVEYYNKDKRLHPQADPQITQVIKADGNGVFSYAMPLDGWWGFAALTTDSRKIDYKGTPKEVEIGAVLWVKTYPTK